jgi:hypothetical protein
LCRSVPDELHECYKLRDSRRFDLIENKLAEEDEQLSRLTEELARIKS